MDDPRKSPVKSRVTQDRRQLARVISLLGCRFTFQRTDYPAVIVDLSLQGALLSAKFVPPVGAAVIVRLESPRLKRPVALDATVVRDGGTGVSSNGTVGRFGVKFQFLSLDLVGLLNAAR